MVSFAITLVGCTRPTDASKNRVSIMLPQSLSSSTGQSLLSAAGTVLTAADLMHVTVFATGGGMSPQAINLESCHGCIVPTPIPLSYDLVLPSGTGRLIQVLAVYQDPKSKEMLFYYGDMSADLNGTDTTLNIPITKLSQGVVIQGQVAGRYLTGTNTGPTGKVDIKFVPGAGKPAMTVSDASIVNGWFSFFILSGATFQYVMHDTGDILWGGPVGLDTPEMDPIANSNADYDKRLRVYIPVHTQKSMDGGTTNYYPSDAREIVWGYWGPGAAGKKVCTFGVSGSTPQTLSLYATTALSSQSPLTINRLSSPGGAVPTSAQLANTTTPFSSIVVQGGGGPDMTGSCGGVTDTAGNLYLNFQKVTLANFDRNGSDDVAGFRGIFKATPGGNPITVSGDPKTLVGTVLPGVETVVDGFRLFKLLGSNSNNNMNNPICTELATGALGFIPGSSVDATIDGSNNFSLSSNITGAEGIAGVSAVVCPVKSGAVVSWGGQYLGPWNLGSGGGGGGGIPLATSISLDMLTTNPALTVVNNVCTPFSVHGRSGAQEAGLPMNTTLTLSSTDASVAIYSDPACSSSVAGPYNSMGSNNMFFLKRSGSGALNATLAVAANNALGSVSSPIHYQDSPGTASNKIKVFAAAAINAYDCIPVDYQSWFDNGTSNLLIDFGTSTSFTLPTATPFHFYTDPGCNNAASTAGMLNTGISDVKYYFMYTGPSPSIDLVPTSATSTVPFPVSVSQPGPVAQINIMLQMSLEAGQCSMSSIGFKDSLGMRAPAPSSMTVNVISAPVGGFFSDATCTTPTSTVSFSNGQTSAPLYYMSNSTGSPTVSASSAAPALSGSFSITVTPPTMAQIFIVPPGMSFTPGSAPTGSPISQSYSSTFTVDIYLVNFDNTIDTTANGSKLTNLTYLTGGSGPAGPSVNFVNGHATISVTAPPASPPTMNIGATANSNHGGLSNSVNVPLL
jgi:hypothetical protein